VRITVGSTEDTDRARTCPPTSVPRIMSSHWSADLIRSSTKASNCYQISIRSRAISYRGFDSSTTRSRVNLNSAKSANGQRGGRG
jgi:hypothetical protein